MRERYVNEFQFAYTICLRDQYQSLVVSKIICVALAVAEGRGEKGKVKEKGKEKEGNGKYGEQRSQWSEETDGCFVHLALQISRFERSEWNQGELIHVPSVLLH